MFLLLTYYVLGSGDTKAMKTRAQPHRGYRAVVRVDEQSIHKLHGDRSAHRGGGITEGHHRGASLRVGSCHWGGKPSCRSLQGNKVPQDRNLRNPPR